MPLKYVPCGSVPSIEGAEESRTEFGGSVKGTQRFEPWDVVEGRKSIRPSNKPMRRKIDRQKTARGVLVDDPTRRGRQQFQIKE